MKIRTDFVTNSSSSSFVVDIVITDKNGNDYSVEIDPDDGGGNGNATFKCDASTITNADSVDKLIEILKENLYVEGNEPSEEELEEEAYMLEVDIEELRKEYAKKTKGLDYYQKRLDGYGENIIKNTNGFDDLKQIKLKRTWYAWGEAASCFCWNLDSYAEDLPELAQNFLKAKGKKKEEAREELEEYLANYNGHIYSEWKGGFPDSFLNADVPGEIVWECYYDDLEQFANAIVKQKIPNKDFAEETTVIDLQKKEIVSQTAEYIILNGDKAIKDRKPRDKKQRKVSNRFDFKIKDNVLIKYNGRGTKVVIPDGVVEIGERAFYKCEKVISVSIPDSVEKIGERVFYNCSKLEEISIPNSVKEIGEYCFLGCESLKKINIPDGINKISNGLFYSTGLKKVTIPEGVKEIGEKAFICCHSLESIIIPKTVKKIGDYAFCRCDSLVAINIPCGVRTIKDGTFYLCSKLEKIDIPETVSSIGTSAFYGCEKLKEIVIPDKVKKIGEYSFLDCKNLKKVVISESVNKILNCAFSGCDKLDDIYIPAGVEVIDPNIFGDNPGNKCVHTQKGSAAEQSLKVHPEISFVYDD